MVSASHPSPILKSPVKLSPEQICSGLSSAVKLPALKSLPSPIPRIRIRACPPRGFLAGLSHLHPLPPLSAGGYAPPSPRLPPRPWGLLPAPLPAGEAQVMGIRTWVGSSPWHGSADGLGVCRASGGRGRGIRWQREACLTIAMAPIIKQYSPNELVAIATSAPRPTRGRRTACLEKALDAARVAHPSGARPAHASRAQITPLGRVDAPAAPTRPPTPSSPLAHPISPPAHAPGVPLLPRCSAPPGPPISPESPTGCLVFISRSALPVPPLFPSRLPPGPAPLPLPGRQQGPTSLRS